MPLLTYGSTLGLAYRRDYKSLNDELARQEQLNAAKQAQDTQKSMWIADKLKKGKTFTKFDSDQLSALSDSKMKEVGALVSDPDFWVNPMAIAKVSQIGDSLLDNEITQRSARTNDNYQRLIKDLADPKYADDEDAAELMKLQLQAYSNYEQKGNVDGIDGAPVKEFTYSSPSLVSIGDILDAKSKFIGKRTELWMGGGRHGTAERVANSGQLADELINGEHAKKFEREYQDYVEATGDRISKKKWVMESLESRVTLDKTSALLPQPSSDGGNGNNTTEGGFKPVEQFVKSELRKNKDKMIRTGSSFIDTDIDNSHIFIKGAMSPVAGKAGTFSYIASTRNGVLATRPADGKMYQMPDLAGKNVQITPMNSIRQVRIGNTTYHYALAKMFIPATGGGSRSLENLKKYGGDPPETKGYEEDSKTKWESQGGMRVIYDDDGKTEIGTEVMSLLPVEYGGRRDYEYDSTKIGQQSNERAHKDNITLERELFQYVRQNRLPAGSQFEDPTGAIYEVQPGGIPKRIN